MRACPKCGELTPLDQFPPVRRGEPRLQTWCRECFAEANARNYARNREREKERLIPQSRAPRIRLKSRLIEFLKDHPCVDCGETDLVVLRFDHLRDKAADVAQLVASGAAWETIAHEIAKCEVRCANCHRLKTAMRYMERRTRAERRRPIPAQLMLTDALVRECRVCRATKPMIEFPYRSLVAGTRQWICLSCQRLVTRAWYVRQVPDAKRSDAYGRKTREHNAALIRRYLESHPCVDCGETNPAVLDFDHLRDKVTDISSMVRAGATWSLIEEEIGKCEVRCANCHARKTARQFGFYRLEEVAATRKGLEPLALTFVV